MLVSATATTRSRPPAGSRPSSVATPANKNENSLTCASPAPTDNAVRMLLPLRTIIQIATNGLATNTSVSAASTESGSSNT